jgi:predicted RNA polymerase sigma factor
MTNQIFSAAAVAVFSLLFEYFADVFEQVVALRRTGDTAAALAEIDALLTREEFNAEQKIALRTERVNLLMHLGREDEAREQWRYRVA